MSYTIDYVNGSANYKSANNSSVIISGETVAIDDGGTNDVLLGVASLQFTNADVNTYSNLTIESLNIQDSSQTSASLSSSTGLTLKDVDSEYKTDLTMQQLTITHETTATISNEINANKIFMNDATQINQNITIDNQATLPYIKIKKGADDIQIESNELQITNSGGSSYGTAGQVLGKDSSNLLNWINVPSSFVGTATSDLNMAGFNITSSGNMSINPNAGANTLNLAGTVDVNTTLQINNGSTAIRVSGGLSSYNATATINMNTISGISTRNQFFTILITGTTASQLLTLPSVKNGYYIVIMNYSTQTWTIGKQSGEVFALGKGGSSAQGSPSTMTLAAGASFYMFCASPASVGTNFIISETFPRKSITNDTIVSSNTNGSNYLKTNSSSNFSQFSSVALTSNTSTGTITFAVAYSNTPVVVATLNSTQVDANNPVVITNITTTDFTWKTFYNIQAGAKLNYYAMGQGVGVNS